MVSAGTEHMSWYMRGLMVSLLQFVTSSDADIGRGHIFIVMLISNDFHSFILFKYFCLYRFNRYV